LSEVKDGPAAPAPGAPLGSALRATGLVSALTLVSRLLGLVREQVFAALLGAGLQTDAFNVAFRIPNLLRDLFAEGALSAAFVPAYVKALHDGGREEAHRLARRVLTVLVAMMGLVVVAGIALAPQIVALLAPGYAAVPGKVELTIFLTRIMMPFLPLVSFAAVAMGMLNAEERFGLPAFSPAMFNLVSILWGIGLWAAGFPAAAVAVGWSVGTLLGGAAQFLVQIPSLRAMGFRLRLDWAPSDPGLRRIGSLMAPATIGLAAVQINIFVNSYFASYEPGAVSWLTYAFRILYLPIGIFGVAAGTVATSGLARRAAAGDMDGVRSTLRQSLSMLAFLTLPATAGLLVLAEPVVRLLYERGRFGPTSTTGTAAALSCYALGLCAYTAVKVLAPAFYALGTPRVPLVGSGLAVATNLLVNLALFRPFGFRAVALGTAFGSIVNATFLAVAFERRVGGLRGQGLGWSGGRMVGAALAMAPLAWLLASGLERAVGSHGLRAQLIVGLVPVGGGVAVYGLLAGLLKIPEAAALFGIVRRRLSPAAQPQGPKE
jgi:putative peptidoglycan lipid II flippase